MRLIRYDKQNAFVPVFNKLTAHMPPDRLMVVVNRGQIHPLMAGAHHQGGFAGLGKPLLHGRRGIEQHIAALGMGGDNFPKAAV